MLVCFLFLTIYTLNIFIMKTLQTIFPLLSLLMSCSSTSSQTNNSSNSLIPYATGLNKPVSISNCGDSRLFITEQPGYIRIIESGGNVNPQPFLDIHERVVYGGERGLLGLAFHPQYLQNGYLYVNYTGAGDSTHISRFSVKTGSPNLADPQSEFKLMTLYQPYSNHKGGDLHFGPDGYLYIGLGDGGSGGDPGNRSQNRKEYLGKILRIDINQGMPYSIPPSNPFYNNPDALGEIWALGLRNPWRFSFDRTTGDLWIADVGQNVFEEINFQPASGPGGENYGWRCYEGNEVFNNAGCSQDLTFPIYTYSHGEECSVTGGYVYRGDNSSPFYGHYFFSDYCSDRIWTLHHTEQGWVRQDFGRFTGNNFSTFGEDATGQLYIAGLTSGTIFLVKANSTSIAEGKSTNDIKILQFPLSGKIRVETTSSQKSEVRYNLYTLNGVICVSDISQNPIFEINTNNLAAGMYVLEIIVGKKNLVSRLIIQ